MLEVNKNQTIYEAFSKCAKEYPHRTAIIYQYRRYSYTYVSKKINALAYSLTKLGYKKNDVITVMLPNVPMAVYLLYAINQIGAIANLIHPLMKEEQLLGIMKKAKSKILFTLDSNADHLPNIKKLGVKIYAVSPVDECSIFLRMAYKAKLKHRVKAPYAHRLCTLKQSKEFDRDYMKDSFYLHSGGATGEPKTIALSSFSLNAIAVSGLKILDEKSSKGLGMMSVLPMFHGFGLCMGIHACLINGAFNVLIPKFSVKTIIKYLQRGQLQTLIGVPIIYERLLRHKKFKGRTVSKIHNAFVGGDAPSEALLKEFNNRMKEGKARARLYEGYGLTETVTVCTVNTHPHHRDKTVGRPIPFTEVKAFKNDKELKPNTYGELYVRGDTLMNGYRFESKKSDPFYIDKKNQKWVRTGDYGKVDKDGYVYFIQRLKRIIKVNGINIFPKEIENKIAELPYIFECYAKEVKDSQHGSMINLYVVLNKKSKKKNYDSELKSFIENKFSVYALPKKIIYKKELPKTLVGKIDEKQLKDE
ncbi:MAG: acyl--CoA ligase [Bacilli bacterium]|nr:acyl--CoA ligase [Bacilli bacterium]